MTTWRVPESSLYYYLINKNKQIMLTYLGKVHSLETQIEYNKRNGFEYKELEKELKTLRDAHLEEEQKFFGQMEMETYDPTHY